MASIQDINALEERIYDAVQEYLDNPDGYENATLHVYLDENEMKYALVTSKTQTVRHQMQSCVLQFIPVACYAYVVGKNTINKTKQMYGL